MTTHQTAKSNATSPATAAIPDVSNYTATASRRAGGARAAIVWTATTTSRMPKNATRPSERRWRRTRKPFRAKVKDTAHASGCHCKKIQMPQEVLRVLRGGHPLWGEVQVRRLRELRGVRPARSAAGEAQGGVAGAVLVAAAVARVVAADVVVAKFVLRWCSVVGRDDGVGGVPRLAAVGRAGGVVRGRRGRLRVDGVHADSGQRG